MTIDDLKVLLESVGLEMQVLFSDSSGKNVSPYADKKRAGERTRYEYAAKRM